MRETGSGAPDRSQELIFIADAPALWAGVGGARILVATDPGLETAVAAGEAEVKGLAAA